MTYSTKIFEERNKILQEAFLIHNIHKLSENDLVIHIRSGDIFSSRPHPNYVPPLCPTIRNKLISVIMENSYYL